MTNDEKRYRNSKISNAMRKFAVGAQCPKCERKGAIKKVQIDKYLTAWICRWKDCGYSRTLDLIGASPAPLPREEPTK